MPTPPLNGTITHPLSKTAFGALASLKNKPRPAQEINPGVINRLLRSELIELVQLPTPYKTRKGLVGCAKITQAGIACLNAGFEQS